MHSVSEIEQIIDEIGETMQNLQAKCERLRALKRAPVAEDLPDRGIKDLIKASEAVVLSHHNKSTVNRWCHMYPVETPGGFSLRLAGRWYVSRSLFIKYIERKAARI